MQLRAIAHSRTGDKGDISNISVIAYDPEDYGLLERHVTAERRTANAWAPPSSPWSCPKDAPALLAERRRHVLLLPVRG